MLKVLSFINHIIFLFNYVLAVLLLFMIILIEHYYHDSGTEWGEASAESCVNQERPLEGNMYPGGSHPTELVVERVLREMSKPNLVYLLNITTLSQLRKDGHPSVFGNGGHRGMDCTHWCLPGVPDTWNQLLYATLVFQDYH